MLLAARHGQFQVQDQVYLVQVGCERELASGTVETADLSPGFQIVLFLRGKNGQ